MIVIKKVVPMPAFQLGTPCAIAQKTDGRAAFVALT